MSTRRKRRKDSATKKFVVRADLSNFQLAKAKSALRLKIYSRGVKCGEIHVGRGSLYWAGAHRHRYLQKRISWGRFAEMMNKLAYG